MENEQETFARIVALATGGRFVLVKRDAMIDAAFDAQKSLAITLDTYTEDNLSGWESDTLHNPRMQLAVDVLRAVALAYDSAE